MTGFKSSYRLGAVLFVLGFVFLNSGNSALADRVCNEKAVERFNKIFVEDWGSVRKWPGEIRVHVGGLEQYNAIAKGIVDHYAQEYNLPVVYTKKTVNFVIISTPQFTETLVVNGERLFSILFDNDELKIYRYIRDVVLTKERLSNPVAFSDDHAINAVIVIDTEMYDEQEAHGVLNMLIVRALFSNALLDQTRNDALDDSVFTDIVALNEVSDCDKLMFRMYMNKDITAGMNAEDVKAIFSAD